MIHADDIAATDAVVGPFIVKVAVSIHRRDLHTVRVHLKEFLRSPLDIHLTATLIVRLKSLPVSPFPGAVSLLDGLVSKMALACSGKRTIESYMKVVAVRMILKIITDGFERPHCMTAGRALSNLIYFLYGFHFPVAISSQI